VGDREMLEVNDLGDAERLLSDTRHLGERAYELLNRGIRPTEDAGEAGSENINSALCKTIPEIEARELNRIRMKDGTGTVDRALNHQVNLN